MSWSSSESASTGTTDSSASKTSLSYSGQYGASPFSLGTPSGSLAFNSSFATRRGNIRFSSARFNPPSKSHRSSKRGRGMSSFGRSTRRTAARPARTKGIFEKLLSGLTEGIQAVKGCVEDMKTKLHRTTTRVNYYMDFEKQVKGLERKVRTLEVHKDRIEEMRDEYILKLKLREGAFNLAQALSNQTSKAAKEKLQEARAEQRDLLEDLCDIEDELETKLGVFKVHINELVCLGRAGGGGDVIETQFKLGSQKWKSKCRVNRHEQTWQDEDIIFLGKVVDELFVKVVEVKKIQGNVLLGNMKCQTREFFSFYPMTVTFDFPSSTAKLSMDVRWTPTIGEDFLSDLDLATVQCIVGGAQSKSASRAMGVGGVVERLGPHPNDPSSTGAGQDTNVQQIRIITEPEGEDLDTQSGDSYGRAEVKTQSVSKPPKKSKRKSKRDESEFVFMDRQSIIESRHSTYSSYEAPFYQQQQQHRIPPADLPITGVDMIKVMELASSPKKHVPHPLSQDSRDNSLSSEHSSGSGRSGDSLPQPHRQQQRSPETLTLMGMLEAVIIAFDEPKELYPELRSLESQLARLDMALKGGRLVKAPSMTLSESQAMDTFEFLGSEDNLLVPPFSRLSVDLTEHGFIAGHRRSNSAQISNRYHHRNSTGSGSTATPISGSHCEIGQDSQGPEGTGEQCNKGRNGIPHGSSGSQAVDIALTQHLIHCESLLINLQSSGPLKHKLLSSLKKLQQEADIISELLNIAAESDSNILVEQMLPELAADDQLMEFWNYLSKDDMLSVSYEQFAVGLDEKFGHSLWDEFPEMANRVLTELMSRILDLEYEVDDGQMVVTIFQYSSYFLSQGSKGVPKCLRELAEELKVTEGLETNEMEVKKRIASMLPNYGYNKGALLAAAHLLGDPSPHLQNAALNYLGNFTVSSPWHNKAVQCSIQLLEHSDQKVRIGACNALAKLEATSAASQLKYLSKRDFSPVRAAASRALESLGGIEQLESSGSLENGGGLIPNLTSTQSLMVSQMVSQNEHKPRKNLQRTRSAELPLGNES